MKRFLTCFFSCVTMLTWAQSIPNDIYGNRLPTTWEAPFPNGKIVSTLHPNGNITSTTISGCSLCGGYGRCGVCSGTGGQFWYGMGIQPCGRCYGSGRCGACNGNGYVTTNTTTYASGLTIGYDNNGNYYVVGPGESRSSSGGLITKDKVIYECPCSRAPTFGLTTYHKCKNCGQVHQCGNHSCRR